MRPWAGTLTRPRAVGTGRLEGPLESTHIHSTLKVRRDLITRKREEAFDAEGAVCPTAG